MISKLSSFLGGIALTVALALPAFAESKNEAVVQAFMQDMINKHDISVADRIFTADFRDHTPIGDNRTVEDFKGFAQAIFTGFPDVVVNYAALVSEGDKITVRSKVQATHKGEFFGVPATGRSVKWTELHVFRIKDG